MATTIPERLDEGINEDLVDLRAQKNSVLPIFRLPPETLGSIFVHGAHSHYYKSYGDPAPCIPSWINVSYVCRHWRNVALNCPTLWSYHFTISLRWTEELLARSKQASLKISIHSLPSESWSRLLEKVLSHAERIQELHLTCPYDALPAGLSLYAPRLQILDISFWNYPSGPTFVIRNGDTLPLRTLRLSSFSLPWQSFNLSKVETLLLSDIPSSSQPNVAQFLATLSCMQGLTDLHLDHALPSARGFFSSGTSGYSTKVTLPCLARLFIDAPLSTVVALLSFVNVPLEAQVKLDTVLEDNSIEDCARLPLLLAQRFGQSKDLSSSRPTIRSLTAGFYGSGLTFVVSASSHDNYEPELWTVGNRDHPLVVVVGAEQTMGDGDRIMADFMADIIGAIPSTHIENVHIIKPPSSLDFWREALSRLDGLRRMKLSRGYMPNLGSLLAAATDHPAEAPKGDTAHESSHDLCPKPGRTYVPALEELEIAYIWFASEDNSSGNIMSEKALQDALSTRKAPSPELTMTRCRVLKERNRTWAG